MKPRINLAETKMADGTSLSLEEHDGRLSLVSHGQQICGPGTSHCEQEFARLACAPFRPARQPLVWIIGLGLGHTLRAVSGELKQRKAKIMVAEPLADLVQWHRSLIPDSPLNHENRAEIETDASPQALRAHPGELHAIVIFAETAISPLNHRPWTDDPCWLAAAYDSLQKGGILAIAALQPSRAITRSLKRTGFDVVESSVSSSTQARRARHYPVWLARKGSRAN